MKKKPSFYGFCKRLSDTLLAFFASAVLVPVFIFISVVIYLDDPGPIIFKQSRAGRYHKAFKIYKFRTMKIDTPNVSTEDLMRMNITPYTRVGPILRRLSLDEIPQLINVIKGEMSLVGPRPALMSQCAVLEGREKNGAQTLRPGITGLAQIKGRDDLSDEEKIHFDGEYLSNFGLQQDIQIILKTIRSVLKSEGVH